MRVCVATEIAGDLDTGSSFASFQKSRIRLHIRQGKRGVLERVFSIDWPSKVVDVTACISLHNRPLIILFDDFGIYLESY